MKHVSENTASTNTASTNTASKIQSALHGRRAASARRRALRAELAAFVTPADRLEIETIRPLPGRGVP